MIWLTLIGSSSERPLTFTICSSKSFMVVFPNNRDSATKLIQQLTVGNLKNYKDTHFKVGKYVVMILGTLKKNFPAV